MTRAEAIAKIKKCMRLSQSSNEHEAAAALRQASKLMAQFQVDETELLDVGTARVRSGATEKPVIWELRLVRLVSDAFGCEILFAGPSLVDRFNYECGSGPKPSANWIFIGTGPAPEIAQYACTVLMRQIRRARTEHIDKHLRRCKRASKVRRADLFCDGWLYAVRAKVEKLAGTEEQRLAIESYIARAYPQTAKVETKSRSEGRKLTQREIDDQYAGMRRGQDATLFNPVEGAAPREALK